MRCGSQRNKMKEIRVKITIDNALSDNNNDNNILYKYQSLQKKKNRFSFNKKRKCQLEDFVISVFCF